MGEQEAQWGTLPPSPPCPGATALTPVIEDPGHRQPLPTPLGQPLSQEPPGKKKQTLRVGGSVSGVKGLVPAGHSLEGPLGAAAKNLVPQKRVGSVPHKWKPATHPVLGEVRAQAPAQAFKSPHTPGGYLLSLD